MSEDQIAALDQNVYFLCGAYATRLENARAFIEDLGSYAMEVMQPFTFD